MAAADRWRIGVIGTGAMGSVYAVMMAEAGHDVIAIDSWQDHVDAINAHGLRLSGVSGDRHAAGITAAASLDGTAPCDLYIIATKAAHVGDAACAVAKVMLPDSLVLTIQNGLGAGERIGGHMPT